MNRFIKQVAVAALVVTTFGAGMTQQAQASDSSKFGKVLLGAVAVGVIAHKFKDDGHQASQKQHVQPRHVRSQHRKASKFHGNSSRSKHRYGKKRYISSGHKQSSFHRHRQFGHSHSYRGAHGH